MALSWPDLYKMARVAHYFSLISLFGSALTTRRYTGTRTPSRSSSKADNDLGSTERGAAWAFAFAAARLFGLFDLRLDFCGFAIRESYLKELSWREDISRGFFGLSFCRAGMREYFRVVAELVAVKVF